MTTIAVAGATGTVGRHVVAALVSAGHEVLALSRSAGVDVRSGAGLDEALRQADGVIDVLNVATQSTRKAEEFFGDTSKRLLAAGAAHGVRHHVLLSIVGIDAAAAGYYAGKLRQERLVRDGQVPWTILRTTQFHEFAEQVLATTSLGPLAIVPTARLRPVAAVEVAAALAQLVAGAPRRRIEALRGPREERLADMARRQLVARARRRRVLEVPLPGTLGRAMRNGTLLGDDTTPHGTITFTDWLDDGGGQQTAATAH